MEKKLVGNKIMLVLLLIIVNCALISAFDFDIKYSPNLDSIYTSEIARYGVNITNYDTVDDRIQIYTISSVWDISPTLVPVKGSSEAYVVMEITPFDRKLSGPYLVPVTFKSLNSDKIIIQNVYVYVKATNATIMEYVPNVAMEVTLKNEIDPRERIPIEIYLRNKNPLNINEMTIKISSDLFNKVYTTSLSPLEEKTNQVLFEIDPLYAPGKHTVIVELIRNNITINQANYEVEIKEYSDIETEDITINGFMSSTKTIRLINHGNYEAVKSVKVPMGFFQKIFTKTSAKYTSLNENSISYISWDIPLPPEKEQVITITTNYFILLLLAIIAITIVVAYYIFRSPVLLFKKAKIIVSTEEGTSEIKVKLHIKNRSGQIMKNVKIMDKHPKITEVESESVLGTTAPTKLLSADKHSSILMWTLESLEPYEERLFTYKLRAKLKIIGNINLPGAKVKFQTKTGERSYVSDGVHLFHKSETPVGEFVDVNDIVKKQ